MKHYQRTLLELEHKHHLSSVGAVASCCAAEYHGTKAYAQEAVAKHRAISHSIRESVAALVKELDYRDAEVERYHKELKELRLENLP